MTRRFARSRWLLSATFLLIAATFWLRPDPRCAAWAQDTSPQTDYCYELPVSITNNTGGALTNYAVRVSGVPALSAVNAGQLDTRAWDILPIIGNLSNEVDVLAQELGSDTAAWWVHVPSAANGQSVTARLFFGNDEQKRNQGVHFTGADLATVADHADFDITNNLTVDVELEMLSGAAQNATLASHWTASTGYRLLLVNDAGTLKLRAQADASTCDVTWDTAWTNTNRLITYTFTAPNIVVAVDGSTQNTCNTGLGAITAPAAAFDIGTTLANGIVRDVRVLSGSTVRARWGFDARSMDETSAVNPTYAGTVEDYSALNHDLTYTFTRSQTGILVSLGAIQLVGLSSDEPVVPTSVPDVVGPVFHTSNLAPIGGAVPTPAGAFQNLIGQNLWQPFYTVGREMTYTVFFIGLSLLVMVVMYVKTRYVPLSLFLGGIPVVYAAIQLYIEWWWVILWGLATVFSWWAVRLGEER